MADSNLYNEKFGAFLRRKRLEHGYTQQQLADMSGTTRETVSRICSMLVKANAIAMTGKDIVIFDENALQEKATKG